MCMNKKIRVNISVDEELLEEAKKKLLLFGGKISTLFNAYLADFVKTMDKSPALDESLQQQIKRLEARIKKLESNK